MRVLLDQIVMTDYGQFDIVWDEEAGSDGDFERTFAGQVNGLAAVGDPRGLYLILARRSGGSHVRIEFHDDEPTDRETWEDVVEVSIEIPASARRVGWMTWAGEDGGELDVCPGSYRVRVSARGRDAGRDGEFADGIVDHYLLELWPSESRPDAILRATSDDAAYWHTAVGGRR